MTKSLLIDLDKCTACRSCIVACKNWNKLEPKVENRNQYELKEVMEKVKGTDKFSDNDWTYIHEKDIRNFHKRQCMHCEDPQCLKNCPAHAIVKYDNGAVVVDREKCEGVGLCAQVCPFDVPVMAEDKKPVKCTLCYNRITQNPALEPACVKACPSKALKFGDRDDLVEYARRFRYVYGGGNDFDSSVIYCSNKSFEEIGLEKAKIHGIPVFLKAMARPVGQVAIAASVAYCALDFIRSRKAKIAGSEDR